MHPPAASHGAQPSDPWPARLAFHILRTGGPWWITLWLILILGGLVAMGMVAGAWVPGAITAVGDACRSQRRSAETSFRSRPPHAQRTPVMAKLSEGVQAGLGPLCG